MRVLNMLNVGMVFLFLNNLAGNITLERIPSNTHRWKARKSEITLIKKVSNLTEVFKTYRNVLVKLIDTVLLEIA